MPSRHLALEDHDFDLTVHFRLHLKSSEMDSFYEGYTIVLGSSGGPIYPVQALLRYLAVVVPHRVTSASAAMGALLIPAVVNSMFQTILQSPVCQAIIRATVFGWVAGIPDHLIKTLGRYISASIASDSSAPGLMALER
jgi:hypothetical protein